MMRHLRLHVFVLLMTLALSHTAHAFAEINLFYFTDAMSASATTANNRMNYEISVGFAVDKKNQYLVGWGYNTLTSSDTGASGVASTYSSTQMGPRFIYAIDKNNEWTVGLAYYLVTNATYDDGSGSSVKWKGTALKFDFGYNFPASGNFLIGVRMNYSSASYTEQLVGSTTYSAVGYTRTSMYPTLYGIYLF
ncbi:MAG: hypothetical protein V4760_05595 [Bdellovibrionota bacterium]